MLSDDDGKEEAIDVLVPGGTANGVRQTYPGAPPQQLPHIVQVKLSPSAYQGFVSASELITGNFIGSRIVRDDSDEVDSPRSHGGHGGSNTSCLASSVSVFSVTPW